jgi:hypothetical protein
MDTAKLRQEERIMLLEEQMIDYCDEISEISYALIQLSDPQRKNRHQLRLRELRHGMQDLWNEYTQLVTTRARDIYF